MKKVSFDNIKNIEFPEIWIEKALNVPSQQKKKSLLPFRYRYAIGLTSCAVLAVLVCLPFLFGMSKDIDFISYSSDGYTGSTQITVDSTNGAMPSENTPSAAVQDSTTVKSETEPSENSAAGDSDPHKNNTTLNSKQPAVARSNGNSNPQAPDNNGTSGSQTPDKSYSSGGSGSSTKDTGGNSKADTASSAEKDSYSHSEEKPTEPEPEILEPANDNFAPAQGAGGGEQADLSEKGIYLFQTKVEPYYAAGTAFCLIEKENGEALGDGGIYSSKRTTLKDTVGNKTVLKFYCRCNFVKGRTYTVNFYNSHSEMIKKSNVTINNSFEYEI